MNTKEYLINLWEQELPATVDCLKAVPDNKSGYTPDPKTRTAKEIAEHIIGHPLDLFDAAETGELHHRFAVPVSNMNEAAEMFEKNSKRLFEKLKSVNDEQWYKKIKFIVWGNEYPDLSIPLRDITWRMFRDIIHHRGQLSTYYRPMGIRNPVIYGLTKELMDEMMAAEAH